MGKREVQRQGTRRRILAALVESLVSVGYVRTTTVEVQRRAGISRGALLHHFGTRAELFGAAVEYLVERNESAVRLALSSVSEDLPPVMRAIRALGDSMRRPAYAAELELWAAARTDPELRDVLLMAERSARRDLSRVFEDVFGPPWTSASLYPIVSEITIELLRGLATSRSLHANASRESAILGQWGEIAQQLLAEA
ncbi:MAG: TetR/AcrR family transcriptional regulator [Acidimicrobiales bacterium]